MNLSLKSKPETETFKHAKSFLETTAMVKELNDFLEEEKVWLRNKANGDTLDQVVPGLGSVQVKKPGGGGAYTNYGFNEENYLKNLNPKQKEELILAGVIELKPVFNAEKFLALHKIDQNTLYLQNVVSISSGFKAPSAAAVVATLNK